MEIGRTHMTVGETLDLRIGSVVTLERLAGETADLLVNGTAIARGEVVVIDEQYGLRITEILDGQHDGQHDGELPAPAAESGSVDPVGAADPVGVPDPVGPATNADSPESPAVTGSAPQDEARAPDER